MKEFFLIYLIILLGKFMIAFIDAVDKQQQKQQKQLQLQPQPPSSGFVLLAKRLRLSHRQRTLSKKLTYR